MIAMRAFSYLKRILTLFLLLLTGVVFAQEDTLPGGIDTQKLIIVKPYSPTVSDAVKLKQRPDKEPDSAIAEKKKVNYDIFYVPVASTFEPEKGRAAGVSRQRLPNLYDNYLALGIGNYTNIFAELYSHIDINKRQNLSIGLQHHSSQGGIDQALQDDKYYDTDLNLGFHSNERGFVWDINLDLMHQLYNWYGFYGTDNSFYSSHDLNVKHNYLGVGLGGNIKVKQGAFEGISVRYFHFGDDFESTENQIVIEPEFEFALGEESLSAILSFEYLTGEFADLQRLSYGYLHIGLHPSFNIQRDNFALNLGAQVVYSSDMENSEHEVLFYPKVKASYRVAGDYLTLYAGAKGGLLQNSYYSFTQENPYVAPGMAIAPTNRKYQIYFGAKGKFTDNLSYDVRASYKAEEGKPLFRTSVYDPAITRTRPYLHHNSFGVIYDDIKTLSIYGELGYSLTDKLDIGANLRVNNFSEDVEKEAWNLPGFVANLNAGYKISKQWAVGADLFFVGKRNGEITTLSNLGDPTYKTISVESFIDANLRVNYQLNDQLGFFLRGNNLFNDNYQLWYGYPVQGIQGMLGFSYQF